MRNLVVLFSLIFSGCALVSTDIVPLAENGNYVSVSAALSKGKYPLDQLNEALLAGIRSKSKETVRVLLKEGANANHFSSKGEQPLVLACYAGDAQIVNLLIGAGAWLESVGEHGETCLHAASRAESVDIARQAIDAGESIKSRDTSGNTPLHAAAQSGAMEIVKLLLSAGAEIDPTNTSKETPLLLAASQGNYDVVKLLLDKGANPTLTLKNGTPLYLAARPGPSQALMEQRANSLNGKPTAGALVFSGSAWKASPRTYVTNYHVIEGAIEIYIAKPREMTGVPAKVIAADKVNDIALLEAKDDFGGQSLIIREKPVISGEKLYVMGFPLSGELGRDVKITDGIVAGRTGPDDAPSQFQMTAPINSGNSGGPIVDAGGAVIGIASYKLVASGVDSVGVGVKTPLLLTAMDVANRKPATAETAARVLTGEQLYKLLNGSVFQVFAIGK